MAHIKRIDLKGFKTFGKSTSILLEKGFTVITGPNGSGKTNIMDAILFALGELSARRLRAENFSKLIFHGSPEASMERAKVAKVTMQFDNSDNRIPLDTTTVTVSREAYRNGKSVYRLNGRRMSRTNIIDTLSMAGISSAGHNFVLQGTITRMAEISPSERRKIIDDMVGIAQYDAEKAEAEEKLRVAEISIKTAIGRIEEVQKRVDDLERERNQLLRFNFIQNEVKRFEAAKISYEIGEIQIKLKDILSKIEESQNKVERLRQIREHSRGQRHEIETEWRKLSSEKVEEGGTRVLEVQIKIGDIKSRLAELTTKIGASTTSLEGLKKVRENTSQQLESVRNDVIETRKVLRKTKRERDKIAKEIDEKQSRHEELVEETTELWSNVGKNSKRIDEIERQLDKLYQNLVALRSHNARSQTTARMLSRRLEDLNTRKRRFSNTLNELRKSVNDLGEVQKEQKTRFKTLQQTLERRLAQKEAVEREISDAGKIAESAREAVVEFSTQREVAQTVASEEMALRSIEEMGELGVIQGVYGRLRKLIKSERGYAQAVEAAAAGWLDSVIVQDTTAAFTCAETLRRLKLGRIKIIPLKEVVNLRSIQRPKIDGVSGMASELVKCARRYQPAVTFVFGDTLVAKDDRVAFKACREGYRTVTVNGNLYEVGGAFESGYYRAPIDFSKLVPKEKAIRSLDEAVQTLQEHLAKRSSDISGFDDEITKTRLEITRLSEAIKMLDGEIARVHRSIKVSSRNVKRIDKRIADIQSRIEEEKTKMGVQRAQRDSLRKETQKLRGELATLRRKVDPSNIQELEVQRGKLGDELVVLGQRLSTAESQLSMSRTKIENVLKTGYDNARVQIRKVEQQISTLESEAQNAIQEKIELEDEVSKLEDSKEELTHSILTARKESRKFTDQIDDIDKQLLRLDDEYERAERLLNQLHLNLQTLRMQLEIRFAKLSEYGFEEPLAISQEELETTESSLKLMGYELERLGAVNQLALAHYTEQVARYKELSLRMNELEKEKQSILAFMDEIERKKRRAFMEAYTKINENFRKYFHKLSDGGEASLKLDNPEEPFSGGMDMEVQFPGKPPILVSGASSGERSVSAVAFLFAIQDYMPTAFYVFDEVDAHLDAFHVAKLGELLVDESVRSQFIVITLKPEMANKATRVYGVYERKGVSNVVSAKFREVMVAA